jgi:hypothetical protein
VLGRLADGPVDRAAHRPDREGQVDAQLVTADPAALLLDGKRELALIRDAEVRGSDAGLARLATVLPLDEPGHRKPVQPDRKTPDARRNIHGGDRLVECAHCAPPIADRPDTFPLFGAFVLPESVRDD